jgi:hypothetical protein
LCVGMSIRSSTAQGSSIYWLLPRVVRLRAADGRALPGDSAQSLATVRHQAGNVAVVTKHEPEPVREKKSCGKTSGQNPHPGFVSNTVIGPHQ